MPAMTKEQLEHFEHFGFVTAEGVIDPEEVIDPVIEEYAGVLDSLADELYEEGKISSRHEDLEFGERMIQVYEESQEIHQGYFDFTLPQRGVTEDTPFWAGPAVFNAMTSPALLDAVESFIGPEIYSNPVQHIRIKVPESRSPRDHLGRVKFGVTPWHQDLGVVTPDADDSLILTVWYPLMDADEENGCLAGHSRIAPRRRIVNALPGWQESFGQSARAGERVRGRNGGAGAREEGRCAVHDEVHDPLFTAEQQRSCQVQHGFEIQPDRAIYRPHGIPWVRRQKP